jgi:hypothetical protein
MPDNTSLTVRIDAKVHWLASYAALEQGMTLAEFVEDALTQALSLPSMQKDEPTYGTEFEAPESLRNEGLWDDDEATRFFHIAVNHPGWLSRSEQKLWSTYCSSDVARSSNRKIGLASFRKFYAIVEGE